MAPRIDMGLNWRRAPGTFAVRWLLVAALAPATIWLAGRGLERVWFGRTSDTTAPQAAATVRQMLEGHYRALFEELSAAAQTAARRPDLVRTARDPASGRALFALAASSWNSLGESSDRAALTIYDQAGQPVGWTGHPSGRLEVPSLLPGFHVVTGTFDVRLVYVAAVMDGRARVGTVAAERVVATGQGIQSPYLEQFDFTVTTSGLPVDVTYFPGEADRHRPRAAEESSFVIRDPSGRPVAEVTVPPGVPEPGRESLHRIVWTLATSVALVGLVGLAFIVAWAPQASPISRLVIVVALVWLLRLLMLWTNISAMFGWVPDAAPREPALWGVGSLLRSPVDVALTGGAVMATAVAAGVAFEWVRRTFRNRRLALDRTVRDIGLYALIQIASGWLALAMLIGYQRLIALIVATSAIDLLHFSFHPWSAARLLFQIGLIGFHASAVLIVVLVFRVGLLIARRPVPRRSWVPVQVGLWTAAVMIAQPFAFQVVDVPVWPSIIVYGVAATAAYQADRLMARMRRRTVSLRLAALFAVALAPSLLFFVSTAHSAVDHKQRVIDAQLAGQVLTHRGTHMAAFRRSLAQIDALGAGAAVLAARRAGDPQAVAFRLWTQTDLAVLRLTSAIEIIDERGVLLSRFTLKLPSYRLQPPLPMTDGTWQVTEDTAPSASSTQRVMSGNRSVYADGHRVATIVVRVAHDYDTLPFMSSHNPYSEVLRSTAPGKAEDTVAQDVELAVYDWQRRAVYTSTRSAWTIDEGLLQRIRQHARPFWTTLSRGTARDEVFVFWDADQLYVLGYPHTSAWGYAVDVAELVVLVAVLYVLCLVVVGLAAWACGRHTIWPLRLPGEVRTSFYGKLLLTFVAAATVPMVILSVSVHEEFEAHVRAEEEAEARTHVTAARRVVEDYDVSGRSTLVDDDDVMVWIQSLVEQDVSVFTGGRVRATSQRDLFAAGLLPPLAPASAYQAIVFDRADQYVGREEIGSFGYMMAAAPVHFDGQDGMLVVPLALRQRDIDSKMNELDRRLLLLTLLVVLGAAALGYWRAERLAAPIGRLTRATRRLARGDFETLPVATPGDEVQRLIGAFNRMAADLEIQRVRLEQSTRLEASAEMARRVAHDIKNPLTPVQLSAEHLLRVAADEGSAPRSVVERCAENILHQVRMLRQIASEFSTFGTAPMPHPESWDVLPLLEETAASYRSGLDGRVELIADVSPGLPRAFADRVLVARALTNVVENALHAIPDRGRILLRGRPASHRQLALEVTDTGSGIAPEVLLRIFEPYFSTRTGGTGLGMAIVKRNIEASGGTVEVTSTPGTGTCVTFVLPAASEGSS